MLVGVPPALLFWHWITRFCENLKAESQIWLRFVGKRIGQTIAYDDGIRFAADDTPMFRGLFRTDRREPVSAVLSELWSPRPVGTAQGPSAVTAGAKVTSSAPAPGRLGKPLDLFQFLRPEIRAGIARAT